MIDDADRLRTPAGAILPDTRQKYFSVLNLRTAETRPKTLEDHYTKVKGFTLRESIPDNIQTHFEVAKNLLLYSWFVYNFISVAEMHAYASIEYALRERIGTAAGKRPGLKRLLNYAVQSGLIEDSGFRHYVHLRQEALGIEELMQQITGATLTNTEPVDRARYSRVLAETIPELRNAFAHGTDNLMNGTYLTFSICCDLINQLFPPQRD